MKYACIVSNGHVLKYTESDNFMTRIIILYHQYYVMQVLANSFVQNLRYHFKHKKIVL